MSRYSEHLLRTIADDELPEASPGDMKREHPNHVLADTLAELHVQAELAERQALLESERGNHVLADVLRGIAADARRDAQRAIATHDTGRTVRLPPKVKATRITRDPVTSGSGRFLDKPVVGGTPASLANARGEAEQDRAAAVREALAARATRLAMKRAKRQRERREGRR
jgi:hypothetical protein